jgi:hypothetical protein
MRIDISTHIILETKRHRLYKSYCRLKLSIEIFSRSWAQKPDIKAIVKTKKAYISLLHERYTSNPKYWKKGLIPLSSVHGNTSQQTHINAGLAGKGG